MTTLAAGSATHVGQIRTINQDHMLLGEDVFAVADGMGGHRGGEVASAVAVEALQATFRTRTITSLVEAVKDANVAIVQRASGDPELRGMGTTMCALALVQRDDGTEVLTIVNVGDSRAYLLKVGDSKLDQVSEDHSLVQQLVRQGQLKAEDAISHPQRNILTRALGIDADVKPDAFVLRPVEGDRYLLCSDGLFNEVDEATIARVLRERQDPDAAAAELVGLANDGGGRDNISVVIVDVLEDAGDLLPPEARSGEHRVVDVLRGGDRPVELSPDAQPTQLQAAVTVPAGGAGVAVAGSANGSAASPAAVTAGGVVVDKPAVLPNESDPFVAPVLVAPVPRRTRLTWRVLLFVVALAGIVAAGVYAVQWISYNTYYVVLDQNVVTVFQGRPGGVLWNEPRVVERSSLTIDQVAPFYQEDVRKGRDEPSLEAAQEYVRNLATTTTTTTTVTTVVPVTTTVAAGNGIPGLDPAAPTSIAPPP